MKERTPKFRYIDWKTPDEMHFSSVQWQSELHFFQDEHRFFEDMLKAYTMPIIESKLFSQIQDLIDSLTRSRTELTDLEKQVQDHTNRLQRLVENIDEPKESKQYRKEHKEILNRVNTYTRDFKKLKKEIFEAVSRALKHQKQKRLLT